MDKDISEEMFCIHSRSKGESDDSVVAILKKQKKEIDEITKSLKEMSEVIKTLQDNSLTKADLEDILSKEKETPNKMVEPIVECCFEIGGAEGNNLDTIFVRGFDCSFPRDVIKSTLEKHFASCGKITRVFVPIECHTGSPLGFVT
ncbi:PREDICTED: uncharacterized protein LOC104752442 [Camelina sativa]|uniref:Uncharacterized protein LOC104752442 n=1 Tax=Camelina sativa TaxID=90675 RepID=A0ABM0WLP8_CAMSA|nr:PREDICTED: uncharacterized protein LOC104752442 [Camelina sativa]